MSTQTTRRTILAGAAALPIGAIAPRHASAEPDDPAFAAIDEHRKVMTQLESIDKQDSEAGDEHIAAERAGRGIREAARRYKAIHRQYEAVLEVETDAFIGLFYVIPTSAAGMTALLAYLGEVIRSDHGRLELTDGHDMLSLLENLRMGLSARV